MPYTREPLSASTHGKGTKVAASSTPGTTIHTGQASTTLTDVVTLYATNTHTAVVTLTLEWGGTTAPDDNLKFDIPPGVSLLIIPDLIIRNSLIVKAFASVANVITIHGFVNQEA